MAKIEKSKLTSEMIAAAMQCTTMSSLLNLSCIYNKRHLIINS